MHKKLIHGGDVYRNRVAYDFSVNINPLGMPEQSMQAAMDAILQANQYPDPIGEQLCEAISYHKHIKKEQIVLGNGAAELLYALCFALRPKKVLTVAPTFQEYEAAVHASGGEILYYYLNEKNEYAIDDKFVEQIAGDIDLVILCNPNNPTGSLADAELVRRIIVQCEKQHVKLCMDECFLEFVREGSERTYLKTDCPRHVIVLRAFTKIYAMAGLRLGYMYMTDDSLRDKIRSMLQPWNTSIPAQRAGIFALCEEGYLEKTISLIEAERDYLTRQLASMGAYVYHSDANYLLIRLDIECNLVKELLEKGILIRDCSMFQGLGKGYYRIAIRSHSENEILIENWKMVLAKE
ncbi:MAG: histidinol-phosphate transaminase [Eubacteriales bacterium]|nr:histidinol-phosphate transaminase [Eubacteriales bacterium]